MEQITDLLDSSVRANAGQQTARSVSRSGSLRQSYQNKSVSPIRNLAQSISGKISPLPRNADPNFQNSLQIREDPKTGIYVEGLTQIHVKSKEQLLQFIKQGMKRRSMNQTGMNKNSSRSHSILNIFLEQIWSEKQKLDASGQDVSHQSNKNDVEASTLKKRHYRKALLTIVDLAGSERLNKSGSEHMRLQEAKNINKSIAALGNCIASLAKNSELMGGSKSTTGIHRQSMSHIPFRDSKLTRLLSESLSGNCKTTICACISPSLVHYEETYSTLLFASRAMNVLSQAMINEKIDIKLKERRQVSASFNQYNSAIYQNNMMLTSASAEANLSHNQQQTGGLGYYGGSGNNSPFNQQRQ